MVLYLSHHPGPLSVWKAFLTLVPHSPLSLSVTARSTSLSWMCSDCFLRVRRSVSLPRVWVQ